MCLVNAVIVQVDFQVSDFAGGFNGSMQHSDQTRIAMKTKAKDDR